MEEVWPMMEVHTHTHTQQENIEKATANLETMAQVSTLALITVPSLFNS